MKLPFFNKEKPKIIPIIMLHGKITTADDALNLQTKKPIIDVAFAHARNVVFLSVNSPGGLPGQSQMLYDYIRFKADERKIKVITFIEDFGASGGYWLSLAGDEIHCLETSVVGSIGVVSGGFGFQKLMQDYKIERRLMTAGSAKVREDMFSEMSEDDKAYKQKILEDMHKVFIDKVTACRPNINQDVFDARTTIGEEAVKLGLVDGINNPFAYAKAHYPNQTCRYYTEKRRLTAAMAKKLLPSLLSEDLASQDSPQLRMR